MQLQRAIAIPRKDCRKQFMIITATTSYLLLNLLHCHPIFCGVKELGASQHNLDQLRTLELLKESIWSIFHHVVHHISTCSISRLQIHVPYVPWATGKATPLVWSVHFGWHPPTPHSRVHGMDRPNTLRSTLDPTSTLAHRLVVIYWASSRLARSPKYPLHNIAFVWKRDMISANMHKICHQVGIFQWTTLELNPIWKL